MAKEPNRMRLRTEILFNLVIIMVFSMLLMSIFILKFSRDFMIERLLSEHYDYVKQIKQNFKTSVGLKNDIHIDTRLIRNINDLSKVKKNFSFKIFKIQNNVLSQIFGDKSPLENDEDMKKRIFAAFESVDSKPKPSFSKILGLVKRLENVKTLIPLTDGDTNKYVVSMEGGGDFQESSFRGIKLMIIVYTVIFAVIIAVFGYVLLSQNVIKPLEKISAEAAKVAAGDLEFKIEKSKSNEIGELARSISQMADKLLNNQKELKINLEKVQKLNEALKEAQNEIVRAEKLASIGRLSSGVAHEIGNPLSAVLGYVELLKRDAKNKEEAEVLERSEAELLRMSRIIKQLLDFSKPVPPELKKISLNEFINDLLKDLSLLGVFKNMETEFKPVKGIPDQTIDTGLLRQVLVNLLNNASFAVQEKYKKENDGKITVDLSLNTIDDLDELKSAFYFNVDRRKEDSPNELFHRNRVRTRKSDPPEAKHYRKRGRTGFVYPKFLFAENEELVKITVEDNGCGIKREDLQKIFDPFYTTKDPGSGVGLGLYMTLNHVENMGGYIDVVSEEGKGTLFLILMPLDRTFS